jgi:hypothetical protein
MLVRAPNLGGPIGAGTGNLVFNTAPALTNGIVNGVVGDTSLSGNGAGFVTHNPGTGLALFTGYGAMPTSGVNTTTVDLTGAAGPLTAATTINAIRIGAGGSLIWAGSC